MKPDDTTSALIRYFRDHARRYDLGANVRIERKLNWGGFVNLHFDVGGESHGYHVKLTRDPDVLSGLSLWRSLSPKLETRYHAPAVVDWIDLEEVSLSGLVLERIPGRPLDLQSDLDVVSQVLAVLERLHGDDELEQTLREHARVRDARASALDHYIDHLEADLAESGDRYPVDRPVLDWMRRELLELRRLFEEETAFNGAPTVAIHGDVWKDNVLVEAETGRWHLVDWDDLTIGDPAIDYATLLWPLARDGDDPTSWLGRHARDPAFMARFRLYFRAALLDEVIDSLADWVEAEQMPEHMERVRAAKLQVYRRAYDAYRRHYGDAIR